MRIALLSYRSKPHCGGQGVYIRHLSRELVALGHIVEVFSGQPYPELDEGVTLTKVPSLDLYREPDPFRVPKLEEFRDLIDVEEFLTMCTAGFPEPKTFSKRAARLLKVRRDDFDIVHDNQVLGYGMLDIARDGAAADHDASTTRSPSTGASTSRRRRRGARSSRCAAGTASCGCRAGRPQGRPDPHRLRVQPRATSSADFGVDDADIQVIPLGVDDVFGPPSTSRASRAASSRWPARTPR